MKTNDLRYIVGSILSENHSIIDEDLKKKFLEKEFKLLTLPLVSSVVKTSFPYISLLSIFIAIYKVYPRIGAYIQVRFGHIHCWLLLLFVIFLFF